MPRETTLDSSVAAERVRAEAAADELRAAREVVVRCMPKGHNQTLVLRAFGCEIENLLRHDQSAICRRCGQVFAFDSARFRAQGLASPRHCYRCRQAKRDEREHAGLPTNARREVQP